VSIACVAYDSLESACRSMKMDLKVGFQAAISNAMDATHAGHATQIRKMQCTHTKTAAHEGYRIGCVLFCLRALRISFFDCIASHTSVACAAYDNL